MCSRHREKVSIFAPVDGTVDHIDHNILHITRTEDTRLRAPISGTFGKTIFDVGRCTITLKSRNLTIALSLPNGGAFGVSADSEGTYFRAGDQLSISIPDSAKQIYVQVRNQDEQQKDFLAQRDEVVYSGRTIIGHSEVYEPLLTAFEAGIVIGVMAVMIIESISELYLS